MAKLQLKSKKALIIILCCALALLIGIGSAIWIIVSNNDKPDKPKINIVTENEIKDTTDLPEDVLDNVDIENGSSDDNHTDTGDIIYGDNENVSSDNANSDIATDDGLNSDVSDDATSNDEDNTNDDNSNVDSNNDGIIDDDTSEDNNGSDDTDDNATNNDTDNDATDNNASDNNGSENNSSDDSNDNDQGDSDVGFIDEKDYSEIETDYTLYINNGQSINDSFMGFGAVYYPWIYWEDSGGRNYTEEQRQIELDRLVESGTTWIRCVIYARPEWYDKNTNTWNYSGEHFDGLVKFFEEVGKRGVEVMLNFGWGGGIQPSYSTATGETVITNSEVKVFNSKELYEIGDFKKRTEMFGDYCATFTKAVAERGVDCVKYITFFSEPSNNKFLGGQFGTPEFESVYKTHVVPQYTALVKSVHDAFTEAGIRKEYKFIGNNQSTYFYINGYTWQQLKPLYDSVKEYLDEFSYHFYNRLTNPKGATYDDFNFMTESYALDVENELGVKTNDTWIDETNIIFSGTDGIFYEESKVGPIYTLRNDPYTATQLANVWLSFLNNGYKTATIWTLTSNLWPGSLENSSEFINGTFTCGIMPNLMDSQVPHNSYYTYSMISRYCTDTQSVFSGDNFEADGMATSCVYDKDGNVTVFVVNSNLYDLDYKLEFESSLESRILYRHLYNPQTFKADTSAKPIGVDRVLVNVSGGFMDTIPAGGVAVYTTSKK